MPPNPLLPLVRAVIFNAINDWSDKEVYLIEREDRERHQSFDHMFADYIARRLCETIDQDGWDDCDRVRRASTKHTWKLADDAPPIAGEDA